MSTTVNACTIIARNYLPFARVLARSFLEHHPTGRFSVLFVDGDAAPMPQEPELFESLSPTDVGLTLNEFHKMALIYDVTECSTAVKPFLLRSLLERDGDVVTYFDPDIWIHAPLDDIEELARNHGIVLTPHRTKPMLPDDRTPTEADILSAGIFNLGFISLGPGTEEFLHWWSTKLRRDAIRDVANDLFTDQRWVDLLPGYFPHHVLLDEGCNVAYWNLDSRDLVFTGTKYEVNGTPLRFFHFSGFAPEDSHFLSKHHAEAPRILLSERPILARICKEYAQMLSEAGYGANIEYAYDTLPDGLRVDGYMRRAYRNALALAEKDEEPEPPDPFDPAEAERFRRWLTEPVGGSRNQVSRYLHQLYRERGDLRAAFPLVPGPDSGAFMNWIATWGRFECNLPDALVPDAAPSSEEATPEIGDLQSGVNVVGYFRAELGVGEAGRSLLATLQEAEIPFSVAVFDRTPSRQDHPFEISESDAVYDKNLVCINADQTPLFARHAGARFFDGRYTIGVWHWEVEEFPRPMHAAFDHVQEVWVASEFTRQAVAKVAPCPVFSFPIPLPQPPAPQAIDRSELKIPDGFMFLFVFDFFSVVERKNPLGVIEAFRRAFRPGEGPILVLKSINGDQRLGDLERLRAAAAEHPDIVVIDRYLTAQQRNGLMASCDCFVSLHRAEGFGLTMAEAMSLGKPVIATGYSGNLEFMSDLNSHLVPYTLVPIGPDKEPYPADAHWADPDLDVAAELIQKVYADPDSARALGECAREDIRRWQGPSARVAFVRDRLELIDRSHAFRSRGVQAGPDRAVPSPLRSPARAVLRLLSHPVESIRNPSPRYRRPAAFLRRVFRRPYRLLWRIGRALPEAARDESRR